MTKLSEIASCSCSISLPLGIDKIWQLECTRSEYLSLHRCWRHSLTQFPSLSTVSWLLHPLDGSTAFTSLPPGASRALSRVNWERLLPSALLSKDVSLLKKSADNKKYHVCMPKKCFYTSKKRLRPWIFVNYTLYCFFGENTAFSCLKMSDLLIYSFTHLDTLIRLYIQERELVAAQVAVIKWWSYQHGLIFGHHHIHIDINSDTLL